MPHLKTALRSLSKTPGFTLIAVLTIAVGIGANTALFSVFSRLILNPVSLPNPSSLAAVWINNPNLNFNAPAVSWPRYEQLRAHARSFASLGVSAFDSFTLTGNGDPQQLNGLRVSASFFPTLGLTPFRGRNFTAEEDLPNGAAVVMLSHELWRTQFGGRESVVGDTITLNGLSWQVVGIMPPRLSNPFANAQVFAPRVFEVGGLTREQVLNGAGYSQPIGRLKPGVSVEQAHAELAALSRDYEREFGSKLDGRNTAEARLLTETLVGNLRPTFYTLLGAVAFVLLIACANVSSLFLGRLMARHKEIAVRQSLGATRGAIIRQFMLESLLFSAVAGALGALIAIWTLSAIQSGFATQLPPNLVLELDGRAFLFAVGVSLLTALLVGLAPAWQASNTTLVDVLKDSARGSSSGRAGRLRASLIIAEVALSVVLLVGSGLLLLSFLRLQRTPPGFDPKGVAAAFVALPPARYNTGAGQTRFFDEALAQLRRHPQVEYAAAALGLPLGPGNPRSPYSVAGRPVLPLPQRPLAQLAIVTEDYFKTLGIPLVAGRTFSPEDREGAPGVCIINETFARRLFPGESAVGKVLLRGRDAEFRAEIVGIIRDVKTLGLNTPAPDEIYYPARQLPRGTMSVVARLATGKPGQPAPAAGALQAILRTAVASADKDQPISFFTTMEDNVRQSLGVQRVAASLTAMFAGVALVLAAVGLYSLLAYAVSQRTSEIGIRMALGAQRRQVVQLVLSSGMKLVAIGLVAGLAGAAGMARLIQSLLFSVQPFDPAIYLSVAVLFVGVALLACLMPSLRASRIDPLVALRAE